MTAKAEPVDSAQSAPVTPGAKPVVSAITVTYHTGPRLKDALHALIHDPQVSEVIVVDNGNPPSDEAWLSTFAQRHRPRVKLLKPSENLGFGRACNLGARAARYDRLLFINPDAIMKRGAIVAMLEASAGHSLPWLVGGRIFGLDGKEQRGARRHELTLARALGLSQWTLEAAPPPSGPIPMDVVSGAFFMMAKGAFLALDGGFDERYFLHVEDIDLCRRVREAGGTVVYQPNAGAMHEGSTADMPSPQVAAFKAESLVYYFRKFARGPASKLANFFVLPLMAWAVRRRSRLG
ncbi:MAG: glycosyltransferase family 2 protein [Pseudomonadota bacterium]